MAATFQLQGENSVWDGRAEEVDGRDDLSQRWDVLKGYGYAYEVLRLLNEENIFGVGILGLLTMPAAQDPIVCFERLRDTLDLAGVGMAARLALKSCPCLSIAFCS